MSWASCLLHAARRSEEIQPGIECPGQLIKPASGRGGQSEEALILSPAQMHRRDGTAGVTSVALYIVFAMPPLGALRASDLRLRVVDVTSSIQKPSTREDVELQIAIEVDFSARCTSPVGSMWATQIT